MGSGPTSGGYAFIDQAIAAGAVAVVIQGNAPSPQFPHLRVQDARIALANIATTFFGNPSRELALFAVTGTDGKTTTTYLLEQIFAHAGYTTGLIGTIEVKIGQERLTNSERMTTPESLDLQHLLRRMVEGGVTHAAIEASSHALALDRLRGCIFAACALTNITADHVEFHGSWEEYFRVKASLFTELAPDAPAVLNRDDEHFERLIKLMPGPVLTYGLGNNAELRAREIECGRVGSRCILLHGSQRARATVPLAGDFNVSNALAAVGLAISAGLSLEAAAAGLSAASPPRGRLQVIPGDHGFDILVDYAHTPNAFEHVLASLRRQQSDSGKVIAVFGAAGNRDRWKRPLLAEIAMRYTDFFYITNEDPFGEAPQTIIEEIASGVPREEEGSRFEIEPERGRAISLAIERAEPGDIVIILGKGHERSIVVEGSKEPWSDEETVREALATRQ